MSNRKVEEEKGLRGAISEQKVFLKYGAAIMRAESLLDRLFDDGIDIRSFSIKAAKDVDGEWLMVTRAFVDGQACVGFHGATNLAEAIVGTLNRLQNRSMNWKEDQYG